MNFSTMNKLAGLLALVFTLVAPRQTEPQDFLARTVLDRIVGHERTELAGYATRIHGDSCHWLGYAVNGRTFHCLYLDNGPLLMISATAEARNLPAGFREAWDPAGEDPVIEEVWLSAFVSEDNLADGTERERYLDYFGHLLFQFSEREEPTEDEGEPREPPSHDTPSEAVHQALAALAGPPIEPDEIEFEYEWGAPAYEIGWKEHDGSVEVTVNDDGQIMLWETGVTGDLPSAVATMSASSEIERALIHLFLIGNDTGSEPAAYLVTGKPIAITLPETMPPR